MTRYAITPAEAGLLKAIDERGLSAIHQLSSTTRITPAEAINISRSLESKDFAIFDESRRMVHLTDEGRYVRQLLQRQTDGPFSTTSVAPEEDFVLIEEKALQDDDRLDALERFAKEDLDSAIERELQQLRQEKLSRKE
ncbi:MAG TPA: hypothetical protein VJ124_17130 [Pyrinomonadaceae bacterium]|nr:hypothetical protein [Pyrinomonadaceae bacterium]